MSRLPALEPVHFELSIPSNQASKFFEALGWQTPRRPQLPPTIATAFRGGEFTALKKLNVPLQNVLHGEQEYDFHKDLLPDRKYLGVTTLKHYFEKSGAKGVMAFYIFQTTLSDATGELHTTCTTTLAVTNISKGAQNG